MRGPVLAIGVFITGCATASGELAMQVRSTDAIARIELTHEATGEALHISAVAPGESEQVAKARVGRWCLTEFVFGFGSDAAKVGRPTVPPCVDVVEGGRGDLGTLVFEDHRLREVVRPNREDGVTTLTIERAMAAVKPEVLACMDQFGVSAGEVLKVKVVFRGATGSVAEASVEPPFADAAAARCVVAAVTLATMPPFADEGLTVVYPFQQ